MDEPITLARPYAVAIFRRAKERDAVEKWASELAFLSAIMADARMRQAAQNPKVRREALMQAFSGLCEGHLDAEAQNFARLLIQNHRLGLVDHIARLFEEYRAEDEGYVNVDVASAFELSAEEQQKLAGTLDAALGRKARLKVTVDRELIGGVFIRAGDRVIDASVRGQVERLAKSLWN